MTNCIKMMKISLDVIEKKLSPLLKVLGPVNSKLELVAANLDKVKHNLVVQVFELFSSLPLLYHYNLNYILGN